jgi:protein tyrosine/serine phosphatase
MKVLSKNNKVLISDENKALLAKNIVEQSTTYSINNQAIKDFDENVTYTSDYSYSEMGTYDHPTSYTKLGYPNGASPSNIAAGTIRLTDINMGTEWSYDIEAGELIYNVSPNGICGYKITSSGDVIAAGQLNPTGKVRTLYGTTLKNCRDLGGWACDGGTVKYGKLFRTSELTGLSRPNEQITDLEKSMFLNLLGIKCEVDLRDTAEQGGTATFDNSVEYFHQTIWAYKDTFTNDERKAQIKAVLTKIMQNAVENKPTFWHCVAGADRTATVAWLLLGLLGVSQSDCDKEYEITSLSGPTRFRNKDYANLGYLSGLYHYVSNLGKSTFKNNIVEAFRIIDIDECLVNAFRLAMIDGNPTAITYDIPPLSITANGTYDVSKANQAIVNVPVAAPTSYSGTVSIENTSQSTLNIDLGFSGCAYFAIFATAAPVDTNTCDAMAWNSTTNYSAWSRYRGSYNQGYGADGGTVEVSGNSITITAGTNLAFCRNTTYKWIAM